MSTILSPGLKSMAESIGRLLDAGVDVNPDGDETTALEAASLEGHLDIVQSLLAAKANTAAADANGWNSLHNAASGGHLSVLSALLAAGGGCSANARTNDGSTPLHLVALADPKVDFKLVAGSDAQGRTAFFAPALVQTLCTAGADPNAASADSSTPLHEAAANSAASTALALLSNGADPSLRDGDGKTPLDVAGSRCKVAPETLQRLREILATDGGNAVELAAGGSTTSGTEVAPEREDASQDGAEADDENDLSWAAALNAVSEKLRSRKRSRPGA